MAITRHSWLKVKNKVCLRNDIHEDLDLSIHLHRQGYQITYATGIAVSVFVRRLYTDFGKLWNYLMLWPRTLRVHQFRRWYFGLFGAVVLYVGSPLLVIEAKIISTFSKK
jgi:hypothetical protein